ncbi:MAG: AmiS/UreI family transporter [Halomonas sp.]|nr:AmiS/UreI family transporter [Halomonas sp.]MDN6296928.1 AmiS/UreI family transporter [Halomonas sp.]MDN6314524.1 AmiS/UreI family transporter [Halomonas sp.]MDN6336026.1 AmiS/UreI family transporter [Halomonas sp.]
MHEGLSLFYVGAVLLLNGLWMAGRIEDREIQVINYFTGGVSLAVAAYAAFGPKADAISVRNAALTLLFAFTYLWIAFNRRNGCNGRGLGYFCLFVALTALPTGVLQWARADTLWGWWSTVNWLAWAVLWLGFYLMLCHWPRMQPLMARLSLVLGVFTGWVPGYLLLNGLLPLGT